VYHPHRCWRWLGVGFRLVVVCFRYMRDVPGGANFAVAGLQLSDKWFVYAMAAQMAATAGVTSAAVLPCGAGLVAGAVYSAVPALRRLQVPSTSPLSTFVWSHPSSFCRQGLQV
jgi:hypothetical protein